MLVIYAVPLVGAIGVIVAVFCGAMACIEIAVVRRRTIQQLDVQYVPTRNYDTEKLAA